MNAVDKVSLDVATSKPALLSCIYCNTLLTFRTAGYATADFLVGCKSYMM